MNSMVEENIEGNRVVKAFVRESYETEKFDERNDDYSNATWPRHTTAANTCPGLTVSAFRCNLSHSVSAAFSSSKGT